MLFTLSIIVGHTLNNAKFNDNETKKNILTHAIIDIIAAIIITLGALMICKYSMFGFSNSIIVGSTLIGVFSSLYLIFYTLVIIKSLKEYTKS